MTNYEHKWLKKGAGDYDFECELCGITDWAAPGTENSKLLRAEPCPERIVQEAVRRIGVELQKVNVMPAKRKDRER